MSNTAQAETRKPEVRPARVWQPTDLLHPIAPEGGFLPNPWQPTQAAGFDPQGFATPVLDLAAIARAGTGKSGDQPEDAAQDGSNDSSQDAASKPPGVDQDSDDASHLPDAQASDKTSAPSAPTPPPIDAQALEKARAEGHAQGMADARAQMQAQAKIEAQAQLGQDHVLLDKLQAALTDLQQSPQSFFEPLKRLSLHLAEQLVLAELQLDGSAIERLVQRCVDDLAQQDESLVTVHLHPDDIERLHSMRERTGLNEGSALRLQGDDSLLPGSVRTSANDAIVEDLIGERLSTLARSLHINEQRWSAHSAFSAERIASDRLPSSRVEDAQPRMAAAAPSAAAGPAHAATLSAMQDASYPASAQAGYDTVAAIDEILNDTTHV
jgi:flagellar biosynthesis/type III secretory pathway protein FliH